jgi:hypothetical protein
MACLTLAILFTFTVQAKIASAKEGTTSATTVKMVAIVSLVLWTGVGVGGRWIGFS